MDAVVKPWPKTSLSEHVRQAPEPPVLGSSDRQRVRTGNVRLNRMSFLRPGPHGRVRGLRVGEALVGVNTILE